MKRIRFKRSMLSLFATIVVLGLNVNDASAFGSFGDDVNAQCLADNRVPTTPFNGDCALCHAPSFSSSAPGKTAYKNNNLDFFCQVVQAANTPPTADAGGPYTAETLVTVPFAGTGTDAETPASLTFAWNFGDGHTGTGANPRHAYLNTGVFTVTLTVSDGTDSTTSTTTATITAPPIADTDGDGVRDNVDNCPTVMGPASNNGCPLPVDTDGDGVMDNADTCPTVMGPASNNGCPLPAPVDTDGDGVLDNVDSCPDVMGPASNNGCPEAPMANTAPVLDMIGDWNGVTDTMVNISLTATDADTADTLTFSFEGPMFLELTDNGDGTAVLSGTPTTAGSFDINVTVTDDGVPSEMDSEMFTLTVTDAMPTPVMDFTLDTDAKWNHRRKQLNVEGEIETDDEDYDDSTCSTLMDQVATITNEDGKTLAEATVDCEGEFKVRKKVNMEDVSCYITVTVAGTSSDVEVEYSPAPGCMMDDEDEDEDHNSDEVDDMDDDAIKSGKGKHGKWRDR